MNPHPSFWHRTRRRPSFWLGLFVACFLAWAWWDSYRVFPSLYLANIGGLFRQDGFSIVYTPPLDRLDGSSWNCLQREDWRFELDTTIYMMESHGSRCLKFPDSLVFFSFVGLWSGWLAWRARVERKATKN